MTLFLLCVACLITTAPSTLLRIIHGAESLPVLDVAIHADQAGNSSRPQMVIPLNASTLVSPYLSVPFHGARLYVAVRASLPAGSAAPVCSALLPPRGSFTLAIWQPRVNLAQCELFRDIHHHGRGGPSWAYVRLMHLNPASRRVHFQGDNRTLQRAVPPITATRYFKVRPGQKEFRVLSATTVALVRSRCEVELERGEAYTLLFITKAEGMGKVLLLPLHDQPEAPLVRRACWLQEMRFWMIIAAAFGVTALFVWIVCCRRRKPDPLLEPR